jgi:hypothetical protein
MSSEVITTISPITNKPVLTRNGISASDLELLPVVATEGFASWRRTTLKERQDIIKKALDILKTKQDFLAKELTEQMGRPIAYTAKEITTAVIRGEYLLKISHDALKDTDGEAEKGFKRFIRKVPVGPVLIIFAWNVSMFIVLLKHEANPLVPIFDPCELPHTSSTRWQHCYPEALPTNPNNRRTHLRDLCRSWSPSEHNTILPLRLPFDHRSHSTESENLSCVLHRLCCWWPSGPEGSSG